MSEAQDSIGKQNIKQRNLIINVLADEFQPVEINSSDAGGFDRGTLKDPELKFSKSVEKKDPEEISKINKSKSSSTPSSSRSSSRLSSVVSKKSEYEIVRTMNKDMKDIQGHIHNLMKMTIDEGRAKARLQS